MSKKILITGGAGFIGTNFVYHILSKYPEYKISIIDKLTYAGNINNLKIAFEKYENRITFYKDDIVNTQRIIEICKHEKPDIIVHFAAESHVDNSIKDPYQFIMTNIIGTYSMLESCRHIGIGRFHLISTDEVFGELPLDDLNKKFTEDSGYDPQNPYSATKASADHLARAYAHTYGINVTISNCTNNIGPYQFPEKIVPWFTISAMHDKPLTIYGDGKNMRDYLYVKDHCEGIDLAIHKGKSGNTYFFSSQTETSINDIAKMILNKLNKPTSLIKTVTDRPGHDKRYAMYHTKASNELGWNPKHNLKESLDLTIEWYLKNQSWCNNVWEMIKGKHKVEQYQPTIIEKWNKSITKSNRNN